MPKSASTPAPSTRRSAQPSTSRSQPVSSTNVRKSSRGVRNEIYTTCAELAGEGFSYSEMQIAIKVVANRLFGQRWKVPVEKDRASKYDEEDDDEDDDDDDDVLPTRRSIRLKNLKISTPTLYV